eukprot:scaffold974_cov368-Prasinococcus_capsulatus_cf.AAC.3
MAERVVDQVRLPCPHNRLALARQEETPGASLEEPPEESEVSPQERLLADVQPHEVRRCTSGHLTAWHDQGSFTYLAPVHLSCKSRNCCKDSVVSCPRSQSQLEWASEESSGFLPPTQSSNPWRALALVGP